MTRFDKRLDLIPFHLFEPSYFASVAPEVERMLEEFGIGRHEFRAVWQKPETQVSWTPRIEIVLEHSELVVRADLPGVEPKDVTVEVKDDLLTLKGTRETLFNESKEGLVKTERLYGEFYRAIPLPEGTIAEATTASFVNGVLEIRLPVPPRREPKTRKVNIEVTPAKEASTAPDIKQTVAV
jgi:HSP20 family protein